MILLPISLKKHQLDEGEADKISFLEEICSKITQKTFFVDDNDDELILKKKTQTLEYKAFPEAIIKIFRNN